MKYSFRKPEFLHCIAVLLCSFFCINIESDFARNIASYNILDDIQDWDHFREGLLGFVVSIWLDGN